MKIIDISWPISQEMTGYKNRKVCEIISRKTFEIDGVRESSLLIDCHGGTHIDAPSHFLRDGATIEQVQLDKCIGVAQVIDCTAVTAVIDATFLQQHEIAAGTILLLKTKNSQLAVTDTFHSNFIYLDERGAEYLVHKKIKAVGIDYLGIERNQPQHTTHTLLMAQGITIIEGLRLAHVQPGCYECICLPIALIGAEASPARAILIQR